MEVLEKVPVMADDKMLCQCGSPLEIPDELLEGFKKGEDLFIYCFKCNYITQIEKGEIVEHIPPRAATFWTETFY